MISSMRVVGSSAGSAYRRVAAVAPAVAAPRGREASLPRPGLRAAVRPVDLRSQAVTPTAAVLGDLIHRMGGAAASLARGAYLDLTV